MKHFGYGKTLLMAVFMLLASMSALAEEVSKTVTLTEAGTLSNLISSDEKLTVTSLTVSGPINGTDVRYLREMAGMDVYGKSTAGKLADLDLTDANIVDGGDYYVVYYGYYYTKNDVLGDYMFKECNLKSIKLPNSVTSIGRSAFSYCSSLTSIDIPNSVTSIGEYAFDQCSSLTSVTIPNSVTSIGMSAFQYCSGLTSVTIPNSVTSIGESAFFDCTGLTSVTIPNSVTSIGNGAFQYCSSLTSVTIPNSVTSIGDRAFQSCKSLTSVTIGNSVTSIGSSAFSWCSSLTSIAVEKENSHYHMDGNCLIETASNTLIRGCNLTSITIPNSVTSIGYGAFNGCSSLTSVTIPNSVTSIGNSAFDECSGLTSVNIPNSVTSICDNAFLNCSSLTSVTIGNSVTSIGNSAFQYCSSLTSVTIPNSVTSIGDGAFDNCQNLTSVTIPNSVTSIGYGAFNGCSSLTSVTIPNSVISIGGYAFYECTVLTSVTIGNSVTSIGESAFQYCSSLTSVTIPNSVTSIGNLAFKGCSSLTSVTIGNSVTSIGYAAFSGCSILTSVTIPNSVTSIGYAAFSVCSGLTSVTIGNSVTSIGDGAFAGCKGLTEVTLLGTALPTCGTSDFANIPSDATLYCKASLIETCGKTAPWSRFKNIKELPFPVTITDAGIATACSDDDLDFTEVEGVKAYIVSGFSPSEGKVLLTRAMKIPANTGFIVKGNAGTYKIPVSATDYTYANLLVGTLAETTVAETDGSYTNYVLGKDSEGKACFCLANGNTVSANKAYLHIPTSAVSTETSSAKTSLNLSFDDEDGDITGFIPVTKLAEETNGNTIIYNLNGQRMQSLTKGLNIVNGKKVLVK